jgi:hypothetical protein
MPLVLKVSTKSDFKGLLEYQKEALVHLIYVQEGPNPIFFGPWGFDDKAANFPNFWLALCLLCFYVFCGILTSFGFSIMHGNINYFL